jgi:hypothetical protein
MLAVSQCKSGGLVAGNEGEKHGHHFLYRELFETVVKKEFFERDGTETYCRFLLAYIEKIVYSKWTPYQVDFSTHAKWSKRKHSSSARSPALPASKSRQAQHRRKPQDTTARAEGRRSASKNSSQRCKRRTSAPGVDPTCRGR